MKMLHLATLAQFVLLPCLVLSFHSVPLPLQYATLKTSLRMTNDSSTTEPGPRVTVVGGTGFVGSRVCLGLVEKGAKVTSVSKTGNIPKYPWCNDGWTSKVTWVATDLESAEESVIDAAIGSPTSIVSCLGVIGNDPDKLVKGNGNTNCAAFASARRGGSVERAVFVSVSSEVMACEENWLPSFFGGYFEGKRLAEACALDSVDGCSAKICIVKPSFIYGGDSFALLPPRVNKEYGSFIEELLSLGLIKFLADVTPGLIKVALRPPSSVDAVAEACISAAMGGPALGKVLDGGETINEITNQPPATGLTNAINFTKTKTIQFIDWAKEEVPKVISKIEEMQNK